MMNDKRLAQCITEKFFGGAEIAPPEDTPMWGAVHSLLYYCSVSTPMILSNRQTNIDLGERCITEMDAAAIRGALSECAKLLPECEVVKSLGWNLRRAEEPSSGEAGKDYKFDRDRRLIGLREWSTWLSNPYDEQLGLHDVPVERRGRFYTFSTIG